jgi:hypothetical protein
MSTDIVNRKINEIINNLTRQDAIRAEHLKKVPVCIFYGEMPVELPQLFQTELISRIGNSEAVEFVCVRMPEEMEAAVKAAVCHLQEKIEKGSISKVNSLYIPVFFMADQLKVDAVTDGINTINGLMRRFGFKDEFDIGFYCIFDYENMDGNICREQLEILQQRENGRFPLGIFTQTNMVRTVEQRYIKAVQAISMHIFLQCILQDISKINLNDENAVKFTLGYWKLDVLKQKFTDNILAMIVQQKNMLISDRDYYEQIGNIIKRITDIDLDRYRTIFKHLPVRQHNFTEKYYDAREMVRLLYGEENAFQKFMKENTQDIGSHEYIEDFFKSEVGNLYAVLNQLETALIQWKNYYTNEKNNLSESFDSLKYTIQINRKIKLSDIISEIDKYCWTSEGRIVQLERRICFIDTIIDYVKSPQFKEKMNELMGRNQAYADLLKIIRDESLHHDELQDKDFNHYSVPEWNMDLLSAENMNSIELELSKTNSDIATWMKKNTADILLYFVADLGEMKRSETFKSFYAARLNRLNELPGREMVFVGKIYENNSIDNLSRMVSSHMPNVNLKCCDWERDTCLEYFAFKELENLSEIYAMD